jgi:hypothetical protein
MDTGSINADMPVNLVRAVIVALAVAIGLALLLPAVWAYWNFKDQPLQHAHPAMATVVAIAPTLGRSDRQTIVVRNAHGTGYVSTLIGATHCDVGDKVPVIQRGAALSAAPATCK